MFALNDPNFTVLHTKYIGPMVADATDHTHIIEAMADQNSRHIALERLPRSIEQPPVVIFLLAGRNSASQVRAGMMAFFVRDAVANSGLFLARFVRA